MIKEKVREIQSEGLHVEEGEDVGQFVSMDVPYPLAIVDISLDCQAFFNLAFSLLFLPANDFCFIPFAQVPTVPKLPGKSQIWSICPMSCLEMKIYFDCPGIPWILRQILALNAQGRPLSFIKLMYRNDFKLLQIRLDIKLCCLQSFLYV